MIDSLSHIMETMLLAQIKFLHCQTDKIGSATVSITGDCTRLAHVHVSDGCLGSLNTYFCRMYKSGCEI